MKRKRKENHGKPGTKALKLIRQYFPKVVEVIDATKKTIIEVKAEDSVGGRRKDPALCAFARACYRSFNADGVIIGLGTSYVIKGKRAVRYKNAESISREIISFDRDAGFDLGRYQLVPHSGTNCLGVYKGHDTHPKSKNGEDRRAFRHYTKGVRVLNLSSSEIR
jgi:hypothetical protein